MTNLDNGVHGLSEGTLIEDDIWLLNSINSVRDDDSIRLSRLSPPNFHNVWSRIHDLQKPRGRWSFKYKIRVDKGSDKCTIGIYAALYIKAPVYNALVQFIHMGVARTYLLNCA